MTTEMDGQYPIRETHRKLTQGEIRQVIDLLRNNPDLTMMEISRAVRVPYQSVVRINRGEIKPSI